MIMLPMPTEVRVSPRGSRAAVLIRTTNWRDNRYERQCHIYNEVTGTLRQLTQAGSVEQAEWADEDRLALLKKPPEDEGKAQVWVYDGASGEGWQLTDHETGVNWFKPFATGILYCAADPDRDKNKARADRFGKFTHLEQEESASALYYAGVEEMRRYLAQVKASTEDEAKELVRPVIELSRLLDGHPSIQGVVPSPRGDAVYVNCRSRDDLVYYRETSVYSIKLDSSKALAEYVKREVEKKQAEKDGETGTKGKDNEDFSYLGEAKRLHLPRLAGVEAVSPDGDRLLLRFQGRDEKMYTQEDIWVMDVAASAAAVDAAAARAGMSNISARLDRWVVDACWSETGIYGIYAEGTRGRLATFGADGRVAPLELGGVWPSWSFHVSASGRMGFVGAGPDRFPEAYLAQVRDDTVIGVTRLTDCGAAAANWSLGAVETVRWTSRDGTEIEGVLRKPANFDPAKRYPLVFVVHGGPTGVSMDYLLTYEDIAYYPTIQFANEDVLVLKPNYRGSMGRGQAFMELNVNNLGVGDLWDIESAIDHLIEVGCVDRERVGCMGWSQGGYISAFAGLHSHSFKAVSVGAGISDWYTYHVSNDIPDFTTDYLSGSPFRDRQLYIKTAPISNLANADTPMLIQHGENDHRVPFSDAMELYRGLKEMGIPVELMMFNGMPHGITKPRENHAVMHQNLAWFGHYLLGQELKLE
jgi:dipeptidyl aminopeptidase/acylaminoacyl peptidase